MRRDGLSYWGRETARAVVKLAEETGTPLSGWPEPTVSR